MQNCVFCKIVKGELPCVKVFEDEQVLAFMDINPISDGHTLIIPKAHAENLWEISGPDLCAVQLAAKKVAAALQKALDLTGVAALQLNGAVELKMTDWKLIPGDMDRIRAAARSITAALAAG